LTGPYKSTILIGMPAKPYQPQTPLPSATIILLRERAVDFQIYLLRRRPGSGFMAGNYVFPGGMVDAGDRRAAFWQDHVDLDRADIARRLGGGIESDEVTAYGIAAVRETFEEAGVLLARRPDQNRADLAQLRKLRAAGRMPEDWLISEVADGGWVIALSALRRWAHWITPERMPRRFDTRFFAACMPPDQQCRPDHHETTHGLWSTPEKALRGNLDGKIPLSPPTLMTLHAMLSYRSLAELMADARNRSWGGARMPRLVKTEDATLILRPDDSDYRCPEVLIRPRQLNRGRLAIGEPFTRLWHQDGIWCPVRR